MIGRMKILSGYASELKYLKGKEIDFGSGPGLTILFGPNGCGKSSVLKIAAGYCGISCNSNGRTGGWSCIHEPAIIRKFENKKSVFPDGFAHLTPGGCKATLEWDGTPTLFTDSTITDQIDFAYFYDKKEDSPDGLSDMQEQLKIMFGKPSSGMLRLIKLKQYFDALKNPPCITKIPDKWKNYNEEWTGTAKKQAEFYAGLPREGPVTFMMDEPDRSFSIENQMQFWTSLIPQITSKYQVIVATHCPFALIHTDANWIDFEPEYRARSLQAIKKLKSIIE